MSEGTIPNQYRIVFQGDSITDGARNREGAPSHHLGQSYAYIIGAKLGHEWAEKLPMFYNRGISGNRVSDLYARWNEDVISLQPNLLSILIGVNDAWRIVGELPTGATDRFARAYRHILEETKEVLPDTKLVLCEPFILNTGVPAEKWSQWSERMATYQQTVRELAAEFGATFVPLQHLFDEACQRADAAYWLWDGVHPTAAGHQLIASQWLSVVLGNEN